MRKRLDGFSLAAYLQVLDCADEGCIITVWKEVNQENSPPQLSTNRDRSLRRSAEQ